MPAHPNNGNTRAMNEPVAAVRYQIRVRGILSGTILGAFPNLRVETQSGETVLAGPLLDQAALYGVLAQIEALGLELLEVRRDRAVDADQNPRPGGKRA
jgi:hypothetical protein